MAFRTTLALSLILIISDTARGNEVITIPLETIWGYYLPGTKDIYELEGDKFKGMSGRERMKHSLVDNSLWRLSGRFRPPEGGVAKGALVVAGENLDALKQANAFFNDAKTRPSELPADTDLTLVFFCSIGNPSVLLDKVQKKNDEVVMKYHFHLTRTRTAKEYIALIPIGKFPAGTIKIKIERLADTTIPGAPPPPPSPPYDVAAKRAFDIARTKRFDDMVRRTICSSCTVKIVEKLNNK